MKKKTIEKIPYMKLREVKPGAKYVAVTAVRIIGHEKHLIVEVYRNEQEALDVPVVRTVLTGKDFGTYFPKTGEWSRGMISIPHYGCSAPIWDRKYRIEGLEQDNILNSEKDLERIKKFVKPGEHAYRTPAWWEYISGRMGDIASAERREKQRRKDERRRKALKDRADNTPDLDIQKLLGYAERMLFGEKHYLYYRKYGARARVACSKCGNVTEGRWKPGISYESQFESLIEEPENGRYGTCPMCGARGEYKAQGRAQNAYVSRKHLFLGQKYKEAGMVFRYIGFKKEWQMELLCEEQETIIQGASETTEAEEIARAYIEPGKEVQTDFHKYSNYSGQNFWDDCNLYGTQNITVRPAPVMRETYENMKGTCLQYSAMEQYEKALGRHINPIDYAERYMHTPQIEMLVKLGLTDVVDKLVRCYYGIVRDAGADRVDAFLGINKEHVKQLIKCHGEERVLAVMQMEKRLGQRWTKEQIEHLAELDMKGSEWADILKYMSVQKALNLIEKYAGAEFGTGCSMAEEELKNTARIYFDYLAMRKALGYDMHNTVYLAPKDLAAAHQKMVTEHNAAEADKRIREAQERFPLIRKHYRRLRNRFYYRDEDYIIRPAKDAGEIIMEGRILHHCVGGDNYLKKHNDGITTILFLRSAQNPDIPYITVEISTDTLNIIQWYGAHDRKPDRENMDSWLNRYVTKLKCGLAGPETEKPEEAAGQQVPA